MVAQPAVRLVALLDATRSSAHLERVCQLISGMTFLSGVVLHAAGNSEEVSAALARTGSRWRSAVCEYNNSHAIGRAILRELPAELAAYIPCEMEPDPTVLCAPELVNGSGCVTPLLPVVRTGSEKSVTRTVGASGWVAPMQAAIQLLNAQPRPSGWSLRNLIGVVESSGHRWRWGSSRIETEELDPGCSTQHPVLTTRSRVLAVVPHYGCEKWLAQCLYSLTSQTRPPDNIVVVDDGSEDPPREIVRMFPEVTLLSTPENIGPENILDQVIRIMDYDAYMVQDADDWCSQDRLDRSLREAERTGAEIVGGQEVRLPAERPEIILRMHPLDVNRAMSAKAAHYVCHAASLIARSLALRVGGLDCTLQVGADTDFILRAVHVGRVVNLPAFNYYRRMRPGSRTSAANTGFGSAIRAKETEFIFQRALRNQQLLENGMAPQVMAPKRPAPIEFRYILGPLLAMGPQRDKDRVRS